MELFGTQPMSNSHRFRVLATKTEPLTWLSSEKHFIKNVLRLKVGDAVDAFDAQGSFASTVIRSFESKSVFLQSTEDQYQPKAPLRTILAVGALDLKNYPVEELNELAVDSLWIFAQRHTPKHRVSPGTIEKLNKRVLESCKQCRRNWSMTLEVFSDLAKVLEHLEQQGLTGAYLDPCAVKSFAAVQNSEPMVCIVGSEMGLDKNEIDQLGSKPMLSSAHLGSLILRSSTALIALASQRL
jgi:16S rRNA (uracil1498-N3)-methyltransferase